MIPQQNSLAAMARRSHPFPYRTRKLSFSAPMVVGTRVPVRVGRCQAFPLGIIQMEEYPSLAEGIGLENRQAGHSARGFESLFLLHILFLFLLSRGGAVR